MDGSSVTMPAVPRSQDIPWEKLDKLLATASRLCQGEEMETSFQAFSDRNMGPWILNSTYLY